MIVVVLKLVYIPWVAAGKEVRQANAARGIPLLDSNRRGILRHTESTDIPKPRVSFPSVTWFVWFANSPLIPVLREVPTPAASLTSVWSGPGVF